MTMSDFEFEIQNNISACCDREKGEAMVATLGRNSRFVEVDVENAKMLEAALRGILILLIIYDF